MKRASVCAIAAALVLTATASGQTGVAVVNVEEVFANYKRPAVLEQQIRAKQQAVVEEAGSRRDQIERKRQALQAFKPGTADYEEKHRALRREEIDFQVWSTLEEEAIKKEHKEMFRAIYNDVKRGVAKVAKQRGYNIVLTYDTLTEEAPDSVALRQQILLQKVIYWEPQIDITQEVLKVINDEFDRNQGEKQDASFRGDASEGADGQRLVQASGFDSNGSNDAAESMP